MGEKRKREHGSEQSCENPGGLGRQGRGSDDELSWVGACWRRGLASALRAPALAPIQEELEFCEKLLQTCFSSPTDDSMDR